MNSERTTFQEMLAALCLIGDGEKGRELFAFANPEDREALERMHLRLSREGEISRKALLDRIRKLRRLTSFSPLLEMHPGWILEKLEGESPRLFGLLCRTLPGEKVRFLLNQFAVHPDRPALPKMAESYRVAPEICELVQTLIESKLSPAFRLSPEDSFSFFHIARMKSDDLRILFWDLGLEEVRKAFSHVEPQVLRAFLARFSPKEAAEIRGRIEHGAVVSDESKREAQKHLISLTLEPLSAGGLLREIGYSVLGRSLSVEEGPWGEVVCQKLLPEEGYRLKRVIKESACSVPPAVSQKKKEEILGRVFVIAEKGLIHRYWKEDADVELTHRESAA